MTYQMNKHQFDQVISLPAQKRFNHFISKITDWEEVWALKSIDGFATLGDNENHICIPLWPHSEYATALAKDSWSNFRPESIDIENFINKWIPGMIKDEYWVAVFPTPSQKGIIISPSALYEVLSIELKRFE